MVFLEKRTIFFECFMDIPDFKTCKVIKIEFNKQIMDRCDSKIDFRVPNLNVIENFLPYR